MNGKEENWIEWNDELELERISDKLRLSSPESDPWLFPGYHTLHIDSRPPELPVSHKICVVCSLTNWMEPTAAIEKFCVLPKQNRGTFKMSHFLFCSDWLHNSAEIISFVSVFKKEKLFNSVGLSSFFPAVTASLFRQQVNKVTTEMVKLLVWLVLMVR